MAYVKVIPATMAAATGSFSVNVGMGFSKTYLQMPSMASSTAFDLYASADGTNYYQVRKENPNTTTVQAWSFIVAASANANGGIVPLPAGLQYYKFLATDSNPAGALGFNIICGDN